MLEKAPDAQVSATANDDTGVTPAPSQESASAVTAGVAKIQGITRSWNKSRYIFFWACMMLIAICVSLDYQTVNAYQPYALSEFKSHSLLSAVSTLQIILSASSQPIMSKVADAQGRTEAFGACLALMVLGFVINATSHSVEQMSAGQIFYGFGLTGLQFIQQILSADTTSLEDRSIYCSALYSPGIFTSWVGAPLVNTLVPNHWRWGYGMWAITFPVVASPLIGLLVWSQVQTNSVKRNTTKKTLATMASEADIFGLFLFLVGLIFLLFPLTINARFKGEWSSPQTIAMMIIGGVSFIGFIAYELRVAKYPILSLHLAKSRTVAAGCLAEALFFCSGTCWSVYFYSFLIVANNLSPAAATNIVISGSVSTAVCGMAVAFLLKKTGRPKWVIISGTSIKLIGGGLIMRYANSDATVAQILIAQIVQGGSSGLISVVAQTTVQAVGKHQDVANVTTLYETLRVIGSATGSAISGAIWTHMLLSRLQTHLPAAAQGRAAAIQNSFVVASSFPVGSPERDAINQSYTDVMRVLLTITLGFMAASFLASLFIEDIDLKAVDRERNETIQAKSEMSPREDINHTGDIPEAAK